MRELARLGHVSRTRVTQILNLLHLAPHIQERLLFLHAAEKGRDPISEKKIRSLASEYDFGIRLGTAAEGLASTAIGPEVMGVAGRGPAWKPSGFSENLPIKSL